MRAKAKPSRAAQREFHSRAWLGAILITTAIVYARSLGNEFVFDDYDMIVRNRFIGEWSFIWKSLARDSWWFTDPQNLPASSYYRPMQDIWLALNYHLFGLHAAGWHAATIALHLINVFLVYKIARAIVQSLPTRHPGHTDAPKRNDIAAIGAAGLFALLPLNAEAIIWASAIPLPLSAAFELGAFALYIPAAKHKRANPKYEREGPARRAISMALYGFALLCHESAIAFPILVAAHAYFFGSEMRKSTDRSERAKSIFAGSAHAALTAAWPFALEAGGYLALRFWVLGFITRPNPLNHLTTTQAMLTIPAVAASYAMLLVTPWRARPIYSLEIAQNIGSAEFLVPLIGLAAFCGAVLMMLQSAPRGRLYLFGAIWIAITLAPALNLPGLFAQALVQDRYLYLPSVGFCIIVADLAVSYAAGGREQAKVAVVAAAACAMGLAAALFYAQEFWHSEVDLFSACVTEVPGAAFCHDRLGMALMGQGDFAGARRELEEARSLDPNEGTILYDLGLVYENLGNRNAAAQTIASALKVLKHPPAASYAKFALIADAAGDSAEVQRALAKAAALPGGAEAAALAKAQLCLKHGDRKCAEETAREILRRDPSDSQAWIVIGAAAVAQNRPDDAIAAFREAAAVAPPEPLLHYLIALELHRLGDNLTARSQCSIALAGAPENADAKALMSEIDESSGSR